MIKKGATKVLAVALSALSVTGGMEINATKIPEKSNKVTTKKSNLKKGILALTPLAVLSLLGIAREMCASETKMPELDKAVAGQSQININNLTQQEAIENAFFRKNYFLLLDNIQEVNDLFKFKILKPVNIRQIQSDNEEYWDEDITRELKNINAYYSINFLKHIKELFGENFIVDKDSIKFIIDLIKILCYGTNDERTDEGIKLVVGTRLPIEDRRIKITRKTLLKLIVWEVIHRQIKAGRYLITNGELPFEFFKKRYNIHPRFPKEIMDLISLSDKDENPPAPWAKEQHFCKYFYDQSIDEIKLEKCNKLLSLLSYYFAIKNLVLKKLLTFDLSEYEKFIEANKHVLKNWLNAQTFENYKEYANQIVAAVDAVNKNNVYRN